MYIKFCRCSICMYIKHRLPVTELTEDILVNIHHIMCTCTCMYMYIERTHVQTHFMHNVSSSYIHMYKHTCTYAYIHVYTCTYMYLYLNEVDKGLLEVLSRQRRLCGLLLAGLLWSSLSSVRCVAGELLGRQQSVWLAGGLGGNHDRHRTHLKMMQHKVYAH